MIEFNLPVAKRLFLFLCVAALCVILGSVAMGIVMHGGMTTLRVRMATVIQDIFIFILPAIATAMLITRQPADFLMIKGSRSIWTYLLIGLTLLTSIPAMEYVISWNASIDLPKWAESAGEWMAQSEENAAEMIRTLMGGKTVGSLVMTVLLVGLLAGFSEELFFRGMIQRLLITSRVNPHIAIWATAVVFSAIHMQFYGFFPRMLLGAYFGYVMWWSRSLWTAVFAHCFNNVIAGIAMWQTFGESGEISGNMLDGRVGWIAAIISLSLTAVLIYGIKKLLKLNRVSGDKQDV